MISPVRTPTLRTTHAPVHSALGATPAPGDITATELGKPQPGSTVVDFNRHAATTAAQHAVNLATQFFLAAGLGLTSGVGPAQLRIFGPGDRNADATSSSPSPWLDGGRVIRLDFHNGISDAFRVDIVAHEYAHGVIERFIRSNTPEANALNEALADVFAVAIENRDESVDGRMLMTGDAYWTIAQIRRAKIGPADHHGEHLMMGVATRPAAYVLRQCGRATMARLYLDAMTRYMNGLPETFAGFAVATLRAAAARFGTASVEYRALRDGWDSTGLSTSELRRRLTGRARELATRLP